MDSRQFYVNGVRANRTWAAFHANATQASSFPEPASAIRVPGSRMQAWRRNVSAIELVYRGGASAGAQWIESRCPVASIEDDGRGGTEVGAQGPIYIAAKRVWMCVRAFLCVVLIIVSCCHF